MELDSRNYVQRWTPGVIMSESLLRGTANSIITNQAPPTLFQPHALHHNQAPTYNIPNFLRDISRGGLTDVEMVRERRSSLALGACIGSFVLLFSTVAADRSSDLPKALRYRDFTLTALRVPTADRSNAIRSQTPLEVESEEFGALVVRGKRDAGPALSELVKAGAEDDGKVDDKEVEEQGARPRKEADGPSTSDPTSGSLRFEETARETSGKSSSTKTITDEVNRLSRTNDLIAVTAKPALDESKVDQKANETSRREANNTNEPAQLEQEREADARAKPEESVAPAANSQTNKLESPTTARETLSADKTEDPSPRKNVEVPDLEGAEEHGGSGERVSLINDTYVNYSHRRNTSTEKSSGTSAKDRPRAVESATNFIPEDRAITEKPRDPKKDVEVVGNVSKPATLRLEDRRPQNATTVEEPAHRAPIDDSKTSETHEPIDETNQQKLVERTTERSSDEETVEPPDAPGHAPKGRTIAFSGLNEFSNQETKPPTTAKIDVPFSRKNVSAEKIAEQKPYPYLKPSGKEETRNGSTRADATTEEASALENTIGRGQADAKFIVTEASDVLENSIQQFKPTHREKAGNESSTASTTPLRPSTPSTTVSPAALAGAQPTNQSAADGPIDPRTTAKAEGRPAGTGNDVPRWAEGRDAITDKGNFDMTGNGITEVSAKPESADTRTHGPPFVDPTTSAPLATGQPQASASSNLDVQTNAESALLIRSTLNATELVTEYPLANSSEANLTVPTVSELASHTAETVATSPTVIDKVFTEDVTDSPGTLDSNGTNEIPSGATGPPSFDETFAPSTTAIEYEFVGLTEATLAQNATETRQTTPDAREPTNDVTTVPTIQDLLDNSSETSTPRTLTVTGNSTETTDFSEKSSAVPDQTTIPLSSIYPTTESRGDPITEANVVEEETARSSTRDDESQRTSGPTNFWTTVSDDDHTAVTTTTEDSSLSPDSKDSRYALNVTETPAESTVAASVATTAATPADSPFVPTSPRPGTPLTSTAGTPAASGTPAETTDDTKTPPTPEEITSLVRIVMEGTWNEICPKLEELKSALAKILAAGTKRSVSNEQIMFHRQPPCPEVSSPAPTSEIPLTSILVYVVDENGRFDSAMTTSLPSLYQESKDSVQFPFKIHSFLLVQETIPDSGNAIAVVVVSVVAFICLVLLAGLLFIMKKRQTRFNYGERCRPVSLDAYSVDSVSAYNSVRRKGVARSSKRSYGNPTFEDSSAIPSHPLNFAGLSSFCNDVNAINEEFASIPQVSAKIDELPAGAELKNRYANVIPLPETRVPLQKINNDTLTEYINASYVRGPKNAMRYYIACQSPMESTVTDFWRMIWEQQCKVVIMLTDLVENGVEKCTEYIPPSEITDCHRLYGDFQVTLKKRETKEKYAISTLYLKNLENNTFREVYHIWYLWPVNGAQSDGAGLIAVLLEARALQRGGPGPIVVHCSPGTGRTGTLIALDLGIRQYEITRTVDVPRVVYTIRRDRAGAVQTKEQYAFIYKALNLYATKLAGGVLDST